MSQSTRKSAIAIMSLLLITGCAGNPIISSNPRSVVVWAGSEMYGNAQQWASNECAKYNRYARFSAKVGTMQWAFDCVD